ncbi:DCC1-like thiol-disulfide oxidoreductase family protein [Halobacillus sp. A5]|uniref:thiol-disulfide oxidoreductase DCC family protein n=1 Tax=Halobacillus sp. A5 TaxID=2880263 RepID=UPI0020A69E9F|nr:DUF393 domain-containing protein [Halobacillus sp. A5]
MNKPIILYDENCYLCRQTKLILQTFDWFNLFKWMAIQKEDVSKFKININDLSKELHLITPSKKILKGYDSLRYAFIRTPLTFVVGAFMYMPGMRVIGEPLYRLIAKNRYRIFKNRCKNGSCSMS